MPKRRGAGLGSDEIASSYGVPQTLAGFLWEAGEAFLGLDITSSSFEEADAIILPAPYEATTSWGRGARWGPRGILKASQHIELYDREFGCEPAERLGIHTLPYLELPVGNPHEAIENLRVAYSQVAQECGHRFLVMLGGEHSVTSAAVLAQADRHEERITVLQLDAHADLRAEYNGMAYSHACVMSHVLSRVDVVSVGVRGVSKGEVITSEATKGSTLIWARDMQDGDKWMDLAIEQLGPRVYLSLDVDYFDPSLVPSTGTPEPGGAGWYETLRFLRRVLREREVVAVDVVELAPIPGLHAPDFLVAKLVYKLISYAFQNRLAGGH